MLTWWFLSYPAAFAISTHLPRKSWENVPATVLILWNPIKLHMNSYSFPLRVLELMVNLQFQPWFPCSKPPFSVVIPANSSKIPFKNPIENRMKIPLKPPIFLKVSTCTAGNAVAQVTSHSPQLRKPLGVEEGVAVATLERHDPVITGWWYTYPTPVKNNG